MLVRKLFSLLFIVTALPFAAMAQWADDYGPEIGLTLNKMIFSSVNGTTSYVRPGYKIGGVMTHNLNSEFSLQPGLFLTGLGTNMDVNVLFRGPVIERVTATYIQIPINLNYTYKIGENRAFVGGGPYVGYAFAISGSPTDSSLHVPNLAIGSDSKSLIKPLDIGLGINAGFQLSNGLFARLSYSISIPSIAADGNSSIRNSNTVISLGWLFKTAEKGKRS